jgi:FtsP/CotA-like multicopper oxidase with cupredoxin domain
MAASTVMAHDIFRTSRRAVLGGLGAAALGMAVSPATERGFPALRAAPSLLAARPRQADTPIWALAGANLMFKQGERAKLGFTNELPVPVVLNWRGLDGILASEPLVSRSAISPGAGDTFDLPLRQAGTYFCELAMLGDGRAQPTRGLPLIVAEREPIAVDRDETLLIEDWQLRADGTAVAPGTEPKDATPVYTFNGKPKWDIQLGSNERLRIRFVSAVQRSVIALKIEDHDCLVVAFDGQPSEPFVARGGVILAPGGRADVLIDAKATPAGAPSSILLHDGKQARPVGSLRVSNAAPLRPSALPPPRPLPSNGLPARLDLKGALRVELLLGKAPPDWMAPASFAAAGTSPAFRVKASRTVVLALTNRSDLGIVFHLHGHHFRLLDRLDDGWKPFWLDTLAIDAGQTSRIAFAAEYAGRWLMESVATDWTAPRLVRWFSIE